MHLSLWPGHLVSRDDPDLTAPPKTEHALFAFVRLNIGFQRFDQDRFFGLFWFDAVSRDVTQVVDIPIELHDLHGKYLVKASQVGRCASGLRIPGAGWYRRGRNGGTVVVSGSTWSTFATNSYAQIDYLGRFTDDLSVGGPTHEAPPGTANHVYWAKGNFITQPLVINFYGKDYLVNWEYYGPYTVLVDDVAPPGG